MVNIEDINRELAERLRHADADSRTDDWLQRLAVKPRTALAGKRRPPVAGKVIAANAAVRQQ